MRSQAAELIERGQLNGYLAYDGGIAVGWCNADSAERYLRLGDVHFREAGQFTKSIVCFEISPEYRGKGIAAALLDRIIADARTEGYAAVESYPKFRENPDPFDYAGPIRMYEKAGFSRVCERGGSAVMRKELV